MAKHRKNKSQAKDAGSAEKIDANPTAAIPNPAGAQVHSFSRTIAQEHGEKAAVLLQYLAHHVSKSKHVHGGRKWFYKTLDDLAAVFPYLKRSTIHATLQKLSKNSGPLLIGDYNKKGYDRTNWFAFRDDNYRKQAQSSKPAYFKVEDAVKYGIVAAVLLGNLVHWIRENRKQDPQYSWHPVSLGEMTKHLPFSKATMHRAFKELVVAKVIKSQITELKRGMIEYALVDETRLTDAEEGGPIADMASEGSGSKSDATVSKSDLTVSFSDMTVSKPDNNTILIENPLVDDPLKDPSYVEPSLPNQKTNTPKTDKLKGVKDVHPFARIVGSAPDTPNPMSSKGTGSSESAKLPKSSQLAKAAELLQLPKSAKSPESLQLPKSSESASSVSSAESPVVTSSPSASTSQPPSAAPGSKKATRVKLSKVLEDRFYKNTVDLQEMSPITAKSGVTLAFDWITLFFHDSKPEELAEFLKIKDQETLYDKLADFFAPHLAKHLERFSNTQERTLLAQFAAQLVMQFLTQAFCGYGDDRYKFVNAGYSYKVSVMLGQKLNPYWDALEKEQGEKLKLERNAILKKRAEQYASKDKLNETRADLSLLLKRSMSSEPVWPPATMSVPSMIWVNCTIKSSITTTGPLMPPTSFSRPTLISLWPT